MNKIKNLLWGLLLAAPLLFLATGCKKFLDRKPLTATLDDLNQGGIEGQIYGLYGAIRNGDVAGQGFGGIPWLAVHNFRSDDSEKGSDPGDGADWAVIHDQFQYVKDHWSTNTYWDHHYVLIGQANTALQLADSLGLTTDVNSMTNIAEARFFRAFAYFDLVRTYGEVPLINFRVYSPADARRPKSTIPQIYAQIDSDLQYAIANLPPNWNNATGNSRFPGRLTKYAAMALQAKAMLYRQNWTGALGLCQQIIGSGQFSLTTDFDKIFTDAGENNAESLFEIQADVGQNGADNYFSWHAIAQGVRGAGDWDLGWGWNAPTQELVDAFPAGDKRRAATILFSGQADGVYGRVLPAFPTIPRRYWNKKVYPSPTQQTFTGNRQGGWINQRVLRLADVILMAAEAANEIGGATNANLAQNWLNQIRTRAGLGNVTFVDQAQMRTAIQNERRYELALEGERFFDLVRWNLATSVLGPLGYQHKNRFYPIPQPAIDFAGPTVLIQNPDYP
jgi:hypothetical protein